MSGWFITGRSRWESTFVSPWPGKCLAQAKEQLGLDRQRAVQLGNLLQALHSLEAVELKQRLFQEAVTLIGAPAFPIPEQTIYISIGENDVLSREFAPTSGEPVEKVVIAIHQKEAITEEVIQRIEAFGDKAILCLFTTPYALKPFKNVKTILVGYENDPDAQRAVFQVLKGNELPKGHLPVTVDGF